VTREQFMATLDSRVGRYRRSTDAPAVRDLFSVALMQGLAIGVDLFDLLFGNLAVLGVGPQLLVHLHR
jgi:hypothetical protein